LLNIHDAGEGQVGGQDEDGRRALPGGQRRTAPDGFVQARRFRLDQDGRAVALGHGHRLGVARHDQHAVDARRVVQGSQQVIEKMVNEFGARPG